MAIPENILALKPKNTRVKATSKPNEFNVIKRTSKIINGKPTPVELGIVGKIIDGKYFPITKPTYEVDFKSYGKVAFCDKVSRGIFDDLTKYYDIESAKKIYIIALLRAINEDIKNEEISVEYETSFISEFFPKVGMSPNTISAFLDKVGKSLSIIENFMNDRIKQYSEHPTIIDGMLKSNTSITNTYSEFSRKSRIKGTKDVSLIYAYDLTIEEPLACMPYAGNMLDYTSFNGFIDEFPIKKGFIIMDKGFDNANKEKLKELNTTYLIPIKSNSTKIKELGLDKSYTNSFKYNEDTIRCKKIEREGKYYYAFKSSEMKALQDKGYVNRTISKGAFKEDTYEKKESLFGLIVFESNGDLELKDIYKAYQKRWEIEDLFRRYKNIIDQKEENVQGDYRLIASEFINFLSCIMTMRMTKELEKVKLLDKYSMPVIMRYLSKYEKRRAPKKPETWISCTLLKYINEVVKKIGI